ncbi:hypothetical protein ACQKP8_05005 [Photobacterium alginatilyticum]|uniref:hypothetical protein n=1 Tax=Photobacterium alginatilyticum TaxID=1775171 RepID=UPI00406941FC
MDLNLKVRPLSLLIVGSLSILVSGCGGEENNAPITPSPTSSSTNSSSNGESTPTTPNKDKTVEAEEKIYISGSYKPLVLTSKNGVEIPAENLTVIGNSSAEIIKLSANIIGIMLPDSAQGEQSVVLKNVADNSVTHYNFTVTDPLNSITKAPDSNKLVSRGFKRINEFLFTQPVIANNHTINNIDGSMQVTSGSTDTNYCQYLTDITGELTLSYPSKDEVKLIYNSVNQSSIGTLDQYSFLYRDNSDQVRSYTPQTDEYSPLNLERSYYVSCIFNLPEKLDYNELASELAQTFSIKKKSEITLVIKDQYISSGSTEQEADAKASENIAKYTSSYKAKLIEQLLVQLQGSQSDSQTPQALAEHISAQLLTVTLIDDLKYQIATERLKETTDELNKIKELEALAESPVKTASEVSAFVQAQSRRNWFVADYRLNEYESIYINDINLIKQSPYSDALKQPYLDFINNKFKSAQYYLGISQVRAKSHIYTYYNKITSTYSSHCSDGSNSQGVDCDLLSSILGLSKESIYGMSLNEQRSLYNTLKSISESSR